MESLNANANLSIIIKKKPVLTPRYNYMDKNI